MPRPVSTSPMTAGSSMRRTFAKLRSIDAAAKILAPRLLERDESNTRRQHAVLREMARAAATVIRDRRRALEVAPHVAALRRIEIERRILPALRLEDRAEQKGPEAHPHVSRRARARRRASPPDRNRSRRNRTRNRERGRGMNGMLAQPAVAGGSLALSGQREIFGRGGNRPRSWPFALIEAKEAVDAWIHHWRRRRPGVHH